MAFGRREYLLLKLEDGFGVVTRHRRFPRMCHVLVVGALNSGSVSILSLILIPFSRRESMR